MSLTLYAALGWAVEKQTISSGGNLDSPVFLSVASTSPNSVRLTFDRALQLEYRTRLAPGGYLAGTLDVNSYSIARVSDGAPLKVIRTIWADSTHVDLLTENQVGVSYTVTCLAGGVMDFWGNVITQQSQVFTGQEKADYPYPSTAHLFTSGVAGMQSDLTPGSEFYPDLTAPNLALQNPVDTATDIDRSHTVAFHLQDSETGVLLSSVRIYVEGNLAYRGDTDSFIAPYNGGASARTGTPADYGFVIQKTSNLANYTWITVRVVATDSAPIPNLLDTTYSFQTQDTLAPYLNNTTPNNLDIDVPRSTNVSLEILDVGPGVDAATVWIKINGVYAWLSGAQQAGFSVTKTTITNGYRYVINPDTDFLSFQGIIVEVYAKDLEVPANILDTTYSFRTADTEAPYLQAQSPAPGDPDIILDPHIILEVVDVGYGVVEGTVAIRVNGTLAWYSGAAQPGFTVIETPALGGYHYDILPSSDFMEGSSPVIAVQAQDGAPSPNSLDTSYSFTCLSEPPFLQNLVPDAGTHDVSPLAHVILEVLDTGTGVNEASVVIKVEGTICWQSGSQQGPFSVTETPISGGKGFHYDIRAFGMLPDNATIRVDVYALDLTVPSPNVLDTFYTFYTTGIETAVYAPLGAFYCDNVSLPAGGTSPVIANRFPPPPVPAGIETADGPFNLKAKGSITTVLPTRIDDAEEVTIDDGVHALAHFIFDRSGTYTPPGGYDTTHKHVNISAALTADNVKTTLISVISAAGLSVTASDGGTALVNLVSTATGFGSLTLTSTVIAVEFVVSGMTVDRSIVIRTGRRLLFAFSSSSGDRIYKLTRIIHRDAGGFSSGHTGKILQLTGSEINKRDYTISHFIDAQNVVVAEEPEADEGPATLFDADNHDGVYEASTDETCTFQVGDFSNPASASATEVAAAAVAHLTHSTVRTARDGLRVRFGTDLEYIECVSASIAFGIKPGEKALVSTDKARETALLNFSVFSPGSSAIVQIQVHIRLAGSTIQLYDYLTSQIADGWTLDLIKSQSPGATFQDSWDFSFAHEEPFESEDLIEVTIYARLANANSAQVIHTFKVRDWLPPTVVSIVPWNDHTLRVKFSESMTSDGSTPASVLHVRDVSGRISYYSRYNVGTDSSPVWKTNVVEAPVASFSKLETGLYLGSAGARHALNNGAFEILEWLSTSLVRVNAALVDEGPADLSKGEVAPTVVVSPYRIESGPDRGTVQPIFCPIVINAELPDVLTLKPTESREQFVHLVLQDSLTPYMAYQLRLTAVEDTSGNEIGSLYSFTSWTPTGAPNRSFSLWDMIPDMNKREDTTQDLERTIRCFDEVAQIILTDIDQFGVLLDPMRTKDEVVDILLDHLGNPLAFVQGLSLQKKRELIPLLVPMYRKRGISSGIEDSVAFFTGKTVTVTPFDIPATTWTLGLSQLNYNTYIGPSRSRVRYSFYVDHSDDLSIEEIAHIQEIIEFVRPAHTHFIGFRKV